MKPAVPLPADETTAALRDLALRWRERLRGRAEVSLPHGDGGAEGFSVEPRAEGAAEVWVMHDADGVVVGIDRCPGWELPRTASSVATIDAVVRAAVDGTIEVGSGRGVRRYRVTTEDGTALEDAFEGLRALVLSMPWRPRLRWETTTPY